VWFPCSWHRSAEGKSLATLWVFGSFRRIGYDDCDEP